METTKLKDFAQYARRYLIEQVSAKLKLVLAKDSAARRENKRAVTELEKQIHDSSQLQVIEQVAYTWFNRFVALRFMDVNRYNRIGVVSPVDGQSQPEILAEAKMGHIDEGIMPEKAREQVLAFLAGTTPSRDPQQEAFRLLLVAACNDYHNTMPYLFEKIADFTELLMPDDLLSSNSILAYTREAMTPNVCQDVEVVGWIYQFYISEKKDEVFEGLKKNKKITPENIPAATQLFTPHWIVRYLVENSLGRLWMLNRPHSRLSEQMDYYIKPQQPEADFLKISSPEEIKVCDPACGSGHMLVYAFDLLYAIYEEEGYETSEIPEKILTHNLYGIEIDDRAGELAAFALTMKARGKKRRFFRKPVQPNICVLVNIHFENDDLQSYMDEVGRDLFIVNFEKTLHQFEKANNFGSLIRPVLNDADAILHLLDAMNISGNMFLEATHKKVLQVIKQADYLSPKYHVVIANPPYMGGKGMNNQLKVFSQDNYPDSKSDFFAMFMERGFELIQRFGYNAMVTMESWMFLSSYEKLRAKLLNTSSLLSMVHMPYLGKGSTSMGINFGTSATVFHYNTNANMNMKGHFCCVRYYETDDYGVPFEFPVKNERLGYASASDFKKILGSPIAYWVSEAELNCFSLFPAISEVAFSSNGVQTGKNDVYVRTWAEISQNKVNTKWFPYNKGGQFRKWYGNLEFYVNWENKGEEIKAEKNSCTRGEEFYLRQGITWSDITSGRLSCRLMPEGCIFDASGPSAFFETEKMNYIGLALLNTKFADYWSKILNPTFHFQQGDFRRLTLSPQYISNQTINVAETLTKLSKMDWNFSEISWDFANCPLLQGDYQQSSLKELYSQLRTQWHQITLEMQRLEEENNHIFIEAYGLQNELTPEVPLKEITLTCNPHYRYGDGKCAEEQEKLLLADTMKEFISYAVGCMFGRYALNKPGLIIANHGETIEDYSQRVPESIFPAEEDNVIPILDDDWFADDISGRFRKFLKVTLTEELYEVNLDFLETAIGKDIGKYFLKDFYNDHVKRYKKRPIYWLFSSPRGSFNALIYMHRYRTDTVSVVLNDYLREYRNKLSSRKSHLEQISISTSALQSEKTKALRDIEKLKKIIEELEDYEREVIYPLAAKKLDIDLDDGVKVNYAKFGMALKKIPGLDVAEE